MSTKATNVSHLGDHSTTSKNTAIALRILPAVENDEADNESAESEEAQSRFYTPAGWEIWRTPGDEAFVSLPVGGHREHWPIRSQRFRHYLTRKFFELQRKPMTRAAQNLAIGFFEAQAFFESPIHLVKLRLADANGNIYLDLCNESWQVVEISPNGWRVIDDPPVRFQRSRVMRSLPMPQRGGHINQLREFLNLDEVSWKMVVAWLIAALRPRGPYPILPLFARQGSGKSMAARLLKNLVDPSIPSLRAEPRSLQEMMIAANNSWCLALDNFSHLPSWMSDTLCRLSSGGGFTTRALFTNQEEIIFDVQRPVLLTSVDEVINRSDLLDRCVVVGLPVIPDDKRRAEAEMLNAFEKVHPYILGALFDVVSTALRRLPSTSLHRLPRMADFALWVSAAEPALGWDPGAFMAAYEANRTTANEIALEACPFAFVLLQMLRARSPWVGTASELLQGLDEAVDERVRRQTGWPKNPRALSSHLRRIAPNLLAAGWQVEFPRESQHRRIEIIRVG